MFTKAQQKKEALLFAAALALAGAAVLASVCVGKYPISISEMAAILAGRPVDEMTRNVFLTLRLPRTAMVVIAGVGLGMAGSVYQTVFRNALATPDAIGVSSGASMGAAFAIIFLRGSTMAVALSAFAGGVLAVLCVLGLVSLTRDRSTATFVLVGVVINALTQAALMTLKFFADPERQLASVEFWIMGSFGNVTDDKVRIVLPIFIIGLAGVVILRWQIALLSLSDDESRMLGVRVRWMRGAALACATLLVASVVCVTGLISFVALIAPHTARLLLGRSDFRATVLSGIVASLLLLLADCAARSLSGGEVPISILTSLVGAPFLCFLMCRRRELL